MSEPVAPNPDLELRRCVYELNRARRYWAEQGEEGVWDMAPGHLRAGLRGYFLNHEEPGGFLCAVLENDLGAAVARADPVSLHHLKRLVLFLRAAAPTVAWGSREKVAAWLAEDGLWRQAAAQLAQEDAEKVLAALAADGAADGRAFDRGRR